MAKGVKLGAQAVALAAVAGLFALLVWRLVHQNRATAAAQIAHGKTGPAPRFTLPRLEGGGDVSLAALRGKAVVLNFWASWCAPCKREAPALEQTWRKYRSKGLVVVGIDANDVSDDARSFARKHGLTYVLLHDRGNTYAKYGLTGVPETFFVNRRGKLVAEHIEGPVGDGTNRQKFARGLALALRS